MSEPVAPNKPPAWLYEREEPDTSTPAWRIVIGWVFVVVALAVAAIFVWAEIDTRHYVVLAEYFGSPAIGAFLLLLLVTLAYAMGRRITTASERRLSILRTTLVIVTVVAGIGATFSYAMGWFRYSPTIVASSPDGERHAAWVVTNGDTNTLRVFVGSGLGQREIGNIGVICGRIEVDQIHFDGDDSIKISTPYNNFVIRLAPSTGVPLNHFGYRCDDPAS